MVNKQKCIACKKKKILVDRSDYCSDCYEVESKKIANVLRKHAMAEQMVDEAVYMNGITNRENVRVLQALRNSSKL